MATPGYYKTRSRALSMRELVRWRGLRKLPLALFVTRFSMRPKGGVWMPQLSANRACPKEKLSERFWQATEWQRKVFAQLGFTECLLSKIERHVNPIYLDMGGITYLHRDGSRLGLLIYHKHRVPPPINKIRENITVAFTAAFDGRGSLTVTNERRHFDPLPGWERMLVQSPDPAVIHDKFEAELRRRGLAAHVFPDCSSALKWIDERSLEAFESRVARGLFVKMSDKEVERARRAMQEPLRPEVATNRGRWLIVFIACVAIFLMRYHGSGAPRSFAGDTTIPYRGETFRMSKRYESYEDYKDDPNNLDTNDLDRIERAIIRAPIPSSFPTEKEFWHALFQLKFPGYGFGGLGSFPQSDGSTCGLYSVEIPLRNKERYVLGRTSGGRVDVLDDFVFDAESNQIAQVKIVGTNLQYLDSQGAIVRQKPL
jgi:hypothetical protein